MWNSLPMSTRMAGSSRAGALTLLLLLLADSAVDSQSSQTQSTSEEVGQMVSGNGTGQSGLSDRLGAPHPERQLATQPHRSLDAPRVLHRTATTITVNIRIYSFSGYSEHRLIVTEDPRNNTSNRWRDWCDVHELDVWPPYVIVVQRYNVNLLAVKHFIIGDELNGCRNGPLKPGTKYYVKLCVHDGWRCINDSAYTEIYTAPSDWKPQPPRELHHSATNVTVSFSLNYYGPDVWYTLVVAEDHRNDTSDPLPSWYEVHALDVWSPYQLPLFFDKENLTSVGIYIIGADKCEAGGPRFCNGPLKPDTRYYVKLRVYTTIDKFTDSAYTVVYMSDGNTNYTVISISIIAVTALILLVVFVARNRCWLKYNEPSTHRLQTCEVRNPFYLNLLFRKECAKEIAEIEGMKYDEAEGHEHIYEEINYAKIVRRNSFENIIVPAVTDSENNGYIYDEAYELKSITDLYTYDSAITTIIGQLPRPDTAPVWSEDTPCSAYYGCYGGGLSERSRNRSI